MEWFPQKRVILSSYEATFAATWGRRVRNTIQEYESQLTVRIAPDSSAADQWETTRGGGMSTAGVGGPITGKGADLLLVDDPVKNFEEANSETYRDKTWEWWTSTAYTRLEPGGSAIITMARWHEDDLTGRILKEMRDNPRAEQWDVINIPAIAEEGDILGRSVGAALWPERYNEEDFLRIRGAVGSYVWSALYQQRPNPGGGGKFRKEWFRYYTEEGDIITLHDKSGDRRYQKKTLWKFSTADLALSTRESADYTVIQTWAVTPKSDLVLIDQWREKREAPEVKDMLWNVHYRHNTQFGGVEKAHYGAAVIQELAGEGYPVKELIADKDKETRAMLASVRMENGKIYFPRHAPFLDALERELLSFPKGAHDDQVDALSYAPIAVSSGSQDWAMPTRINSGNSMADGFTKVMG